MKCKHFTCHQCSDGTEHIKSLVVKYKAIPKGHGPNAERLAKRLELRELIWQACLKLVPDDDTAERT